MKSFAEYRRDALRYRALKHTEEASPWKDVLGPHKRLDSLADALVQVVQQDSDVQLEEEEREVSHYQILKHFHNAVTGQHSSFIVGKATTKNGARRAVDRRDKEHGAYVHSAHPIYKDTVKEDAPTMGISAVAGLSTEPNVSKQAQRKWTKRSRLFRRKSE